MSRLVRLYPPEWRDRYGAEFAELVAIRRLDVAGSIDVIRGAIDAHLHPQVRRRGEPGPPPGAPDQGVVRGLGIAAISGVAFWIASFAVMLMGPVRYDGQGAYRDGSAAGPIFLLAVILLAGGLVGQLIKLPDKARVARLNALAAIPALVLFGFGPWMFPFALIAMFCLAWLAIAAGRAGQWGPLASAAVTASCLGAFGIIAVALLVGSGDRMAGGLAFLFAGMALVPAWLTLGAMLIVRPAGRES